MPWQDASCRDEPRARRKVQGHLDRSGNVSPSPVRICLVFLTLLAGCSSESPDADAGFRKDGSLDFLRPDGTLIHSIDIEIAEDEASRQRGLMERRQMTLGEGMLFIFAAPDSLRFWMANTPIPLDIMFLAADTSIVNIARRTRPLSRENILSEGLAQYVVEVRGGFSDRFGIDDSVHIRWRRAI